MGKKERLMAEVDQVLTNYDAGHFSRSETKERIADALDSHCNRCDVKQTLHAAARTLERAVEEELGIIGPEVTD